MKRLILIILLIFGVFIVSSCGKDTESPIVENKTVIDGVTYTLKGDCYYVTGAENNVTRVLIKEKIGNFDVTTIGKEAFMYNTNITEVTIPGSIKTIEENAFFGCHKLVEVYNFSSLEIKNDNKNGCVGRYAKDIYDSEVQGKQFVENGFRFYSSNKENLLLSYEGTSKDVVLPEKCKGNEYEIYKYAFYNRRDITSITFPQPNMEDEEDRTIYKIGERAFYNCTGFKMISLPQRLEGIDKSSFSGCVNLEKIDLPEGIVSISDYAFDGCKNLKEINSPKSVTSIGAFAFSGCLSLESIELTDNMKSIGMCAFRWCTSLKEIKLYTRSISSVGASAFEGCESLTIYCDNVNHVKKWGDKWNPDECTILTISNENISS